MMVTVGGVRGFLDISRVGERGGRSQSQAIGYFWLISLLLGNPMFL